MSDSNGDLLRMRDVGKRLSLSVSMVKKEIALGHLAAIRIGRAVRVHPEDLEAYIAHKRGGAA